ncbi:Putative LOC100197594 [Caligus rogercresseyi]|uniref:LOC100197594 n=1 Tax=Caligus rogercresseyi TaxID=217165 RepID=A0A7T8HJY7_CALRO|nr:Putative LOC100197594 [Caligus rogercresseyi]
MEKRLDRCKIILNWLKKKPCLIKIFSDEKIFTVDQVTVAEMIDGLLSNVRMSKA